MKINKLSFAVGNIFGAVVVSAMVVACGSGPSGSIVADTTNGNASGSTNYGTILASKIKLVRQAIMPGNNIIRVQANQLPDNVEVLASQVVLDTSTNSLQSTNLQTALDTEIAVDVSTNIVGVWDIQNFSSDGRFQGATETGRVEFKSDGTYTVISGGFAVAGVVADGTTGFATQTFGSAEIQAGLTPCIALGARTFRVIDGVVQVMTGTATSNAVVLKNTSSAITLMGSGAGCGNNAQSITRMTRQVTATPTSTTPSTTTKSVVKTALNG